MGADTEIGMLVAEANSAICVQNFDDSLNSAIHITYRISLRSSSLREPRYPSLGVLVGLCGLEAYATAPRLSTGADTQSTQSTISWVGSKG